MSETKILQISKKDLENLFPIYNKHFYLSPWSREFFFGFFENVSRQPRGFLLENNGRCLGFIWGRLSTADLPKFDLCSLWVDPQERGNGYARLLVERLLDLIRRDGLTEKVCLHFRESTNLESFYSKLGFSNHQLVGAYSNGESKHFMELVL